MEKQKNFRDYIFKTHTLCTIKKKEKLPLSSYSLVEIAFSYCVLENYNLHSKL